MKIKKEIKEENIETEETKTENVKKEEDASVVSSFRASLSRFANPSSPPSTRAPPKRPPDSNPNPSSSASLTETVAVARPSPVRQDERNNEAGGSVSVDPSPAVQTLRRSPRKRKENAGPSLDAGDGDGDGGDIRPSKKMKKTRRGNPRAPEEEDLSHLGGLPEYLAEGLDGTFLLTPNPTCLTHGLPTFERFPLPCLPSYFTVLFCGIKYVKVLSYVRQSVDSKHHKARGARLLPSDTIMQTALITFGRACISPVSILFPRKWHAAFAPRLFWLMLDGKRIYTSTTACKRGLHSSRNV
jgi:hypothetical protein